MTLEQLNELKKKYPEYSGKLAYNSIDLTNKLFGNWLALYRTKNREGISKNRQATWVCECQCDKKTIALKAGIDLRQGHTTGCGCTKGNRTEEIPTGTHFGEWEIIRRVENKQDRVYYLCRCLRCGVTEAEISRRHLVDGSSTSCEKCRMEKMRQSVIKDETDKIYGFLLVKREATEREKPRHDRTGVYWICDCLKCGQKNISIFGDYLRNGDTQSCGCLNSKNETKIAQLLQNINIDYQKQYSFSNLVSPSTGYRLYFDFAIFENSHLAYLIEYDGQQHFSIDHEFHEGGFQITRQYDLLKNKYCFEHNIPLIRIPYHQGYDLNDLKLETTRFLLTKENEKEYYQWK